jgi:hypothetical protein
MGFFGRGIRIHQTALVCLPTRGRGAGTDRQEWTAAGLYAGKEEVDGEDADRRRRESSSNLYRLQLEGGSGFSGMQRRPGAWLAPASSNQGAYERDKMSRRESEVGCVFPLNNGGLL